jgi:hypothetical protein
LKKNLPGVSLAKKDGAMIDLHCHTTASDGIYDPEKLVKHAAQQGLDVIAVTDHDTVAGVQGALKECGLHGCRVVPGVEFSIDYEGGSFHLLGLLIDPTFSPLVERLAELARLRETRGERMVLDLQEKGINITLDEVRALSGDGSLGRPHVARVLVEHGYAETVKGVFSKFLMPGLPGFVPKEKISFDEALDLTRRAGGMAVVAHPVSLARKDPDDYRSFISELAVKGVRGLEAWSTMHTPEQVDFFRELGRELGLYLTGGSDFHGDKDEVIGHYGEDVVPIPETVHDTLQKMEEELGK